MKNLVATLISIVMCTNLQAQIKVFNEQGKKITCVAEDIDITFNESSVLIPKTMPAEGSTPSQDEKEFSTAVAAILSASIPALVNAGFKFTDSLLARNIRSYEADYTHSQSYLDAGKQKMPDFTIKRLVWQQGDKNEDGETALRFDFKAQEVSTISEGAMVYYIDFIEQKYTKVKIKKNDQPDYSIAISLVFLKKDGNSVYNINPITVRSSKFGQSNVSKDRKYRTDIFMLPKDAYLTKVSVQIIETNPRKIAAEKILATWTTYKDDIKTGLTNPMVEQLIINIKNIAADDEQWRIAQTKNTKESYQAYLDNNPLGRHFGEAKIKISALNNPVGGKKNDSVGN
jgi:hypothetical protein